MRQAHPVRQAHPIGHGGGARRRPPRRDGSGASRWVVAGLAAVVVLAVVAFALISGSSSPDADGGVAAATGAPMSSAPDPARVDAGAPLPACDHGDVFTAHQRPDDWARTLLDTTFMLRADYVPPDLVPVTRADIEGRGEVRDLVIDDLAALAAAARADGASISVDSAYRSFEQQKASFESYRVGYGEEPALLTVARPGHSEHQLGTTLDFEGDLAWLEEHAPAFGFVMSYPEDASPERTCYRAEAWHWRYVGRDVAARVTRSGLSLREWLWAQAR